MGRHDGGITKKLVEEMDEKTNQGRLEGWTQDQYLQSLNEICLKERHKLRSGERALNKNKRPWSDNSDLL